MPRLPRAALLPLAWTAACAPAADSARTTAQVAVGSAVVSAGTDTAGRFAQLAEGCRMLGRLK